MRFFHVTDPGQVKTQASLEQACAARDIDYIECIAGRRVADPPRPGDGMYRSTGMPLGVRLELELYDDGVATFYATRQRVLTAARNPWIKLRDAGLPVVRAITVPDRGPAGLSRAVAEVGGYPVVLKVLGGHTGIGVMRVESPASMQALMPLLDRLKAWPLLMEYFPLVAAHRLTVIGDEVHGPYTKRPSADDFRTNTEESIDDGPFEPRQEILDLCLATARAVELEFGGVDILEDAEGRLVVTEINNPAYYVRQEEVTGIDVSGLMLEHLQRKARRLTA